MQENHVRRQVYDLSIPDLQNFPVWEFALDEEGVAGQDEATVRPYLIRPVNPRAGTFIVQSKFVLADGSMFDGHISTPAWNSHSPDIRTTHPAIVTERGQVDFWFGMFKPKPDHIQALLDTLGKRADQVFPLTYKTSIDVLLLGFVSGQVEGFSYLDRGNPTIIPLGSLR